MIDQSATLARAVALQAMLWATHMAGTADTSLLQRQYRDTLRQLIAYDPQSECETDELRAHMGELLPRAGFAVAEEKALLRHVLECWTE